MMQSTISTFPPYLSLAIWLPILFGVLVLAIGRDKNAGMVRMMSLVGAFYYIRVVKVAYFEEPVGDEPVTVAADAKVLFGLNGAAVLLLGIVPGGLIAVCLEAVRQAMAT